MNYLKITNKGLICPEDLILIGSSTKRQDTSKIGMFGSGWKYALSWLLRNDCTPVIFSGKNQIEIDTTVKLHRDTPVNVITINGQESSLTTQMGPKWSGWMALREIISNAIDEGEHTMSSQFSPTMSGTEGVTTIFVPLNNELAEVMLKYDQYFAFNRKENYKFSNGRIFVKTEPSQINVYRRGIRCFDEHIITMLDFDLNDVEINEDRLAYTHNVLREVKRMAAENTDPALLKMLIKEGSSFLPNSMNDNILKCCKSLLKSGETFTTQTLIRLGGKFLASENALIIHSDWYKRLTDLGLIENPFEMLNGDMPFIRTDGRDCSGVKYYIKNFGIEMEVVSGSCETDAFFRKGTAYIKENTRLDDMDLAAQVLGSMNAEDWAWYIK